MTLHLTSGEKIQVAGRIIRCQVGSTENGAPRYDLALRFDESIDLFLPAPLHLAPQTIDYDMLAIAVRVPHDGASVIDQWAAW
jgi:hypothetical protein